MLFRVLLLVGSLFFLTTAHAQVTALRLNEVLANNTTITNDDGTVTSLVEIVNSGDIAVDMEGCSLSDSNAYPRRYVFPPGSIIEAHAFLVLQFDSRYTNEPISSTKVGFGINASGGFLHLYSPIDDVTPIDTIEYGLQIPDFSIGRVTDGTGPWQLTIPTLGIPNVENLNVPAELGSQSVLKINEWMANNSDGSDYFELYNPTNKPISIGGCYLTDHPANITKFRIPDLSYIGTGVISGYLKFEADCSTNKYPADHVNFSLNDNGAAVGLYDANYSVIDFVSFGPQTKGISEGRLPDGEGGIAFFDDPTKRVFFPKINDYDTASPGAPNFLILTNLSINEILTHTDPPLEDAVEILNLGSTDQDISGWWLSNQRLYPKKYLIPNGTALTPGGFHVIYEGAGSGVGFNSTTAAVQPFTFNAAHGDQVVLSQVDAEGKLTGYIVYEEFEAAANGISFGHYNTSVPGDYKFVAMSATTFGFDDPNTVLEFRQGPGQTNAYPKVGPIVISEIMFAPSNTIYGTNIVPTKNPEEEYIELRNITSENVPLFDPQYPTNHWRLQKAISFVFPLTNLAPNSFCLAVGFDPETNAAALANFRTLYNVPSGVPIFGPWIGQLNDDGDAIELYRPDPAQVPGRPDAGFVPFIRIDKVNYRNRTSLPWPGGASGTGLSLQRKNSLLFGNDPFNWAADAPSAGRASITLQDTDGDGIPDGWETANGFDPDNTTDAALDADNDGVANLGEYLGGTNPRGDQNSVLRVLGVIPSTASNMPAVIRFLAYSNASYSVQFRKRMLPSSDWQRLGDVLPGASNRIVEVYDPNAFRKFDRYYRIVAPAAY